jgi:hypothetical protein
MFTVNEYLKVYFLLVAIKIKSLKVDENPLFDPKSHGITSLLGNHCKD